jgi:hypothetical protein
MAIAQKVFAEASTDGFTAAPKTLYFDRVCASAKAPFVNNTR